LDVTVDKTKTLAIGAFLMASFAWLGWIVVESVISGRPVVAMPWLNACLLLLGAATALCMPLVVAWHLYKAWCTEFNEDGVSQPQLRGRVRVRWIEFTSARVSGQLGVDLIYPGGRVVVAAGLYSRPESVAAFVVGKLSSAQPCAH
jgi:hypothetical protein